MFLLSICSCFFFISSLLFNGYSIFMNIPSLLLIGDSPLQLNSSCIWIIIFLLYSCIISWAPHPSSLHPLCPTHGPSTSTTKSTVKYHLSDPYIPKNSKQALNYWKRFAAAEDMIYMPSYWKSFIFLYQCIHNNGKGLSHSSCIRHNYSLSLLNYSHPKNYNYA